MGRTLRWLAGAALVAAVTGSLVGGAAARATTGGGGGLGEAPRSASPSRAQGAAPDDPARVVRCGRGGGLGPGGGLVGALDRLVDDGILTADQAEAVRTQVAQRTEGRAGARAGAGAQLGRAACAARLVGARLLIGVTSDLTGLTREAVRTQLRDGESLAEIAAGAGVTREELIAEVEARLTERLDQAVAAGRVTAEERDLLLELLVPRLERGLDARLDRGDPAAATPAAATPVAAA